MDSCDEAIVFAGGVSFLSDPQAMNTRDKTITENRNQARLLTILISLHTSSICEVRLTNHDLAEEAEFTIDLSILFYTFSSKGQPQNKTKAHSWAFVLFCSFVGKADLIPVG